SWDPSSSHREPIAHSFTNPQEIKYLSKSTENKFNTVPISITDLKKLMKTSGSTLMKLSRN
ncbi:unnamed protein product, partial [Arabidopsis halleri]